MVVLRGLELAIHGFCLSYLHMSVVFFHSFCVGKAAPIHPCVVRTPVGHSVVPNTETLTLILITLTLTPYVSLVKLWVAVVRLQMKMDILVA